MSLVSLIGSELNLTLNLGINPKLILYEVTFPKISEDKVKNIE